MASLDAWTKRLPGASGEVEPFQRVEATLQEALSGEAGVGGVMLSLQREGVARGVRVVETDPRQVVVSGSLPEILASRDMIISEIHAIKGTAPPPPTTREVGVMCELLPSPQHASTPLHTATPRHTTTPRHSAATHRSPRRCHSVLSRPISPEPKQARRKARKQLDPGVDLASCASPEAKQTRKRARKTDSEVKCEGGDFPACGGKRKTDQSVRAVKVKVERDDRDDIRDPENNESKPDIEILLGDLKMEPVCNETIIVSDYSNPELRKESSQEQANPSAATKHCAILNDVSKMQTSEGETLSCVQIESNNKENIELDSHYAYKPKDDEEGGEEGGEELVENSKIICEAEMSLMGDARAKDAAEVNYKFSCQICSYKSMRENHFVKHMKLHDKGLALYKCGECPFVSIRASHLRRHQMSHAQQVLRCHLCSYTCDDAKLLAKHVRVKHHAPRHAKGGDVEQPVVYECEECGYKSGWRHAFARHRRTHAKDKMLIIHTCQECPYKTMRREHFLRHIKNVHQNHRPFLCDVCGKAFKRQDALKQHHVTHYQHAGEGGAGQAAAYGFVCRICKKVCRSAAYLKEHMATHSEERSFLCEVCGASFKTRSVQRNHVQTIHRRPRSFPCLRCDKKFNTRFALRRHMKQHDTSLEEGELIATGSRHYDLDHKKDTARVRPRGGADTTLASPVLHQSAAPSAAQSAYHITINGQPAFILPSLDHHAITDAQVVDGDGGGLMGRGLGADLRSLADPPTAALAVPLVPQAVHIVDQDGLSGGGELILAGDHYQGGAAPTIVSQDPGTYGAPDHASQTLLYLTSNFS